MSARRKKRRQSAAGAETTPAREIQTPAAGPPAVVPQLWPLVALLGALLLVTLAAYHPAWRGGVLWDDDAHITRADLRSLHGLWRIWFDVGATQQYYPVVHSAFWLMHRLWGDEPLGYHLVNIGLHASAAFLFALILRRLAVPGAVLAAFLFAVHPIQAESVAWMTELKNTLSGVCYLGAALAYLRYDVERRRGWYGAALGLFVLALLSKSVTATLPAALLVVFWWQRGRLDWRADARPLVPFFVLGAGAGLVTAWIERTQIGAQGSEFQFTLIERCLIAGRAIWFYLGKLINPAQLAFIYPRWDVSQRVWWQYLPPLGVIALLAGLWMWRVRSRAPLAAMLLFIGTLFPALGFLNVYPFVFSFVADHFQYLAGLGLIALFAAGVARLGKLVPVSLALRAFIAVLVFGAPATVRTWEESRQYVDAETLYRATLSRNPSCPMCLNNLAQLELERAEKTTPDSRAFEAAMAQYREALRLKPDSFPEAHNNLGTALMGLGRLDEAKAEYLEALRYRPNDAGVRRNLSLVLVRQGHALQIAGRDAEAIGEYREALQLNPDDVEAHGLLADAFSDLQAFDDAVPHYREFLRAHPTDANALTGLGIALVSSGHGAEALAAFRSAVVADPSNAHFRQNLARALLDQGEPAAAADELHEALLLDPRDPATHEVLGRTLALQRRFDEARRAFERALQLDPTYEPARDGLRSLPRTRQ